MKDSSIKLLEESTRFYPIYTKIKYFLILNDSGVWGEDPSYNSDNKIVIRSTEQTIDGYWNITTPAYRNLNGLKYADLRILPGDLLITKSSGSKLHIGKTCLANTYFATHECYFSNFIQRIRVKNDLVPKYIWYIFNSPLVREQFVYLQNSTSGIGNINATNIRDIIIPHPPLPEQQRIADYLDKQCSIMDKLAENLQQQIEKLKEYKQSVITEAVTKGLDPNVAMKDSGIEWIGEIPKNWSINKIKYVCTINPKISHPCYNIVSYVPMECVKNGYMESKEISVSHISSGLTIFSNNDIIMAKVTPCFENGNIAIATDLTNGLAYGSSELFVFRVITANLKYIFYLLQNDKFKDYAKSTMVGTGGLKRVSPNFINSLSIPFPPLLEQQQIANYLDKRCEEIDKLIKIKQEKIDKLSEYKKSLIYECVTGKRRSNHV